MNWTSLRALSAGQIDSGFSSAASFVAGIFAVARFDAVTLGVYSLLVTAWVVATVIPTALIFSPTQVFAVRESESTQFSMIAGTSFRGSLVSLGSCVVIAFAGALSLGDVARTELVALTTTAALLTVISPVQEHVRRMLHLAQSSWTAATMSAVQFATTVTSLFVIDRMVGPTWAAFGSIALGNVVSFLVPLPLIARSRNPAAVSPGFRSLVSIGGWLVGADLFDRASQFGVAIGVKFLAGTEILGYTEASRVVARPVTVFGTGLVAVLGPRLMAAAVNDPDRIPRLRRLFWFACLGVSGLYVLAVGPAWSFSPVTTQLPTAYVVPGLVAAAITAMTVLLMAQPYLQELLGAKRQRLIFRVVSVASVAKAAFAGLAGVLGAYTLATATVVHGVIQIVGLRRATSTGPPPTR